MSVEAPRGEGWLRLCLFLALFLLFLRLESFRVMPWYKIVWQVCWRGLALYGLLHLTWDLMGQANG